MEYQNSEKRQPSWTELLCERFNDDSVGVLTKKLPNLHDKFNDHIVCARKYDLTPDKCKEVMASMKKKVVKIIRKYNLSGNGSDMAEHDYDEDGVGGAEDTQLTYGRFNKDLAVRRAQKKGRGDLILMDGDDRKEFLYGNTPDLLYWWMLMDENNLIYIFVGKLDSNNSACSDVTPAPTAGGSGFTTTKKGKTSNESLTREMVENVAQMKKTADVGVKTDIRHQIDSFKDKAMNLEDELDQFFDVDVDNLEPQQKRWYIKRLKRRHDEVNKQIGELERDMEDLALAPKRLNYMNNK